MNIAMLFPGQGSHSLDMMCGFNSIPIINDTFEEASNILGYNLFKLIKYGPYKELNKTWKTQPALLSSSVAIYRLWLQKGGKKPKIMAGHSLGEYSALVCAHVIKFTDAIKLVKFRGIIMDESCPKNSGSMTVIIGLKKDLIYLACQEATTKDKIVEISNFNAEKQIVISGHKDAIKKAILICKKMGAKSIINLPITVPSHSSLMKPAALKLKDEIEKILFKKPIIPIINNVNAKCETELKIIKKFLIKQLYSPVLWLDTMKFLASHKIKYLLEIGPGQVLTNLSKRILKNNISFAVNNKNKLFNTIDLINQECK